MAICPFAVKKLIAPPGSDPRITPRVAILHVDAGGAASLYNYFRYRSGGIESHFHVKWDGTVEQYRDTDFQADANRRANDFAVSIETQGWENGTWTKAQLRSIKRLLVWLHEVHNIPLVKIDKPYGSGVGYHTLFGAPSDWTPVAKSCPGPNRKKQFESVLVPWMKSVTSPRRRRLTLITANIWRENKFAEADLVLLVNSKAHVIGLNEARPFKSLVKALPGYQAIYAGDDNTPILLRDGLKELHRESFKLSKAVGLSPARYATVVCFEHLGVKRAVINCHLNSHVQEGKADPHELPRVAEYIRSMVRLVRIIKRFEREGYVVNLMGDMNWSFTRGKPQWDYAPRVVFGALGYRAQFAHGATQLARPKGDERRIEYIFHKPSQMKILAQRFVSPEHSDHPFHEVVYVWELPPKVA